MRGQHITAIVLAAGKGSRMQSDLPKQYMLIDEKPVVFYSLKTFEESSVDDIVLVTAEEDIEYCKENIIQKYGFKKIKAVVAGGTERYWSVHKGLDAAKGAEYVLIHDAARPCITNEIVEKSIFEVMETGCCTVGVPVKDTIKIVGEDNVSIETPSRDTLWQIQTPQSFCYRDLVEAYRYLKLSGDTDITDDTMIMERYLGRKTKVILGDYCNIKITTPEDLFIAQTFLQKNKKSC